MFINFVLVVILIGSLGGIIFIIVRKFPILANIDLSQTNHQEQQKEVKRMLIKQQIKKDFKIILNQIQRLFSNFSFFVSKIFKKSSS